MTTTFTSPPRQPCKEKKREKENKGTFLLEKLPKVGTVVDTRRYSAKITSMQNFNCHVSQLNLVAVYSEGGGTLIAT